MFRWHFQIVPAQTENSNKVEKVTQKPVEKEAVETAPVPKEDDIQQMEVDTPSENTQSKASTAAESVPPSQPKPTPIEKLLPAPITDQVEVVPTKMIEQPVVLESAGVSAVADTTTTIVIDSDAAVDEPPQNNTANDSEPIELHSSPSDDDSKGPTVTNSRPIISQPDAIVELESSSNEGDTKDAVIKKAHDSLDLELINSDSSHSANEVQIDENVPASQAVPEKLVPTSTVESDVTEVTEIVDEPANATNNNAENLVHSCESSQNSSESINNQSPIAIPEKLCTITGKLNRNIFISNGNV